MIKRFACAVLAALIVVSMVSVAYANADPTLLECPFSHAHVWNVDQCPRIGGPFAPGSGGGGSGGLIGRIIGAIGGLLGL